MIRDSFPLRYETPASWARLPLSYLDILLSDHAYLERKAASNALELLNRWPHPYQPEKWTETLSSIARDEAMHLNAVVRLLRRRGYTLARLHKSLYANDLRSLVRLGEGPWEIVDRLLISALIEARSCERFDLLGTETKDSELEDFYKGLAASEWGHYRVFLELAHAVRPEQEVTQRWNELRAAEARIIQAQPSGPGLHTAIESTTVSVL